MNPNKKEKTPQIYTTTAPNLDSITTKQATFTVYKNRIASSNHFPSPADLFEQIKKLNAMVIDMESVAIYQYAWAANIPALVVRGVSNVLDDQGNDDNVSESDVSSSDHAAMMVQQYIEKNL